MIGVRAVSCAVVFTLGLAGAASSQRGAHQISLGEDSLGAVDRESVWGSGQARGAKMAHFCRSKTETIIQVHGIGPFSIDLVDPGYELTKTGVSLIAGSPSGPKSSSSNGCFNLRIGDRVRASYGEGTVVGAQCFPANRVTQYWVQKAKGDRFWATLEELKKV